MEREEFRTRSYLYRYSLAIVIHLLWWIKNGSQLQTRLGRASNDFIDLSFAVYDTYYDGLMTSDEKAAWMHQNLCLALHAVGAKVPGFAVCGRDRTTRRARNQPSPEGFGVTRYERSGTSHRHERRAWATDDKRIASF